MHIQENIKKCACKTEEKKRIPENNSGLERIGMSSSKRLRFSKFEAASRASCVPRHHGTVSSKEVSTARAEADSIQS